MENLSLLNWISSSGTALTANEMIIHKDNLIFGSARYNVLNTLSFQQSSTVVGASSLYISIVPDISVETSHYQIEFPADNNAYQAMLATEPVLRELWDTPEEDEAWAHL